MIELKRRSYKAIAGPEEYEFVDVSVENSSFEEEKDIENYDLILAAWPHPMLRIIRRLQESKTIICWKTISPQSKDYKNYGNRNIYFGIPDVTI